MSRQDKIEELRRTITHLSKQINDAHELVDKDPAMAKLILKEAFYDKRFTYR